MTPRLSLYVPGDTLLHRAPASWKMAALLLAGIGMFLVTSPAVLGPCAGVAAVALLSVRTPPRQLARHLTGPFVVLALVAVAAVLFQSAATAVTVGLRLSALLLAALAVTLTTRTSEILDVLERVLRPLERTRLVNAAAVGLAVSLALRFIPEAFHRFHEIREAQAARGLSGSPVALLVPLAVRMLKSAEDIAAAVDARCYPPPAASRHADAAPPPARSPAPAGRTDEEATG
ncbi:energy-coupling factor transporter transmembrane protein EcfT [Streptomyces sp. HU2014]|uniref:Cobalt transporter n=1 Tax=Streptomyces albireticuli TaxID=1940 RepID=A0A1Z2LD31_9ACTN|nr:MULTISPECIES: energy-coupling factor transporter transmembrane protein EcfT [Streptomyces]ARZ72204.1 cobalt transporter [Streptomyces albireticuli]UQI45575.1 energy-coupling factor transporter transmembrane protein EcfT [Streptomyces sp. HU2014]